jgi:hypothetical protein
MKFHPFNFSFRSSVIAGAFLFCWMGIITGCGTTQKITPHKPTHHKPTHHKTPKTHKKPTPSKPSKQVKEPSKLINPQSIPQTPR